MRKIIKKLLLVVCAFTLVLGVVACGGDDSSDSNGGGSNNPNGGNPITCKHDLKLQHKSFGTCGSYAIYYSCDCGKEVGEGIEYKLACNSKNFSSGYSYDENGNAIGVKSSGTCPSCSLKISIVVGNESNGCNSRSFTRVEFDDCKFEISQYVKTHKNLVAKSINLNEFGGCGGSIYVTACRDCGEAAYTTNHYAHEFDCQNAKITYKKDSYGFPTEVVESFDCDECGLHYHAKDVIETIDGCHSIKNEQILLKINSNVLINIENKSIVSKHTFRLPTYTVLGDCIKDGVEVKSACAVCPLSVKTVMKAHVPGEEKHIDFEQHGTCGGDLDYVECLNCKTPLKATDGMLYCDFSDPVENGYIDSEGNQHYTFKSTCHDCGLVLYQDTYSKKITEKEYYVYLTTRYSKDGEVIIEFKNSNYTVLE